jgi:hypothetical protein
MGVSPEALGGEQTGGQGIALGSIFRDKADFVDSNIRNGGQRSFQILGQD